MRFLLAVILISLVPFKARAVPPVLDLNVFYFSDTFTYGDVASSYQRSMYDAMIGMEVTKKGRWVLGWNYGSYTFTENDGTTTTTLKITDMGPKVMYALDKEQEWNLAVTYNLISKGAYDTGGTPTDLRGTSLKGEFGYQPMIGTGYFLGLKLNYYTASFVEEVTNETALEKVTHKRAVIYPSISLTIRWD